MCWQINVRWWQTHPSKYTVDFSSFSISFYVKIIIDQRFGIYICLVPWCYYLFSCKDKAQYLIKPFVNPHAFFFLGKQIYQVYIWNKSRYFSQSIKRRKLWRISSTWHLTLQAKKKIRAFRGYYVELYSYSVTFVIKVSAVRCKCHKRPSSDYARIPSGADVPYVDDLRVNWSSLLKWLLLQNCLKINETPFFSLKLFPVISAGPQKYKHKIGHN